MLYSKKQITKILISIVSYISNENLKILSEESLFAYGLNPFDKESSKMIKAIYSIFGIKIPASDFNNLILIKDACNYIYAKLEGKNI
jgi:hypothetical protein